MFCRDLLPRYLVSPDAAAALSLTCKWMYENVGGNPVIRFAATVHKTNGINYESAYYKTLLFNRSLRHPNKWEYLLTDGVCKRYVPKYAAKFIDSGLYCYSHNADECPEVGDVVHIPMMLRCMSGGDWCYAYIYRIFVPVGVRPPPTTLADIPDEIIALLISHIKDPAPFGLASERLYKIFTTTPDYMYRLRSVSPNTPAKYCLKFTAEQLYAAGNVAGLAYWYRKTRITPPSFIELIACTDLTPIDSAPMAAWLFQNFRPHLINETADFVLLGHSELVKLLLPFGDEDLIVSAAEHSNNYKMFRLLFENYPHRRGNLIEQALGNLIEPSILTFISLNGINPVKVDIEMFAVKPLLLRCVIVSHVLECAGELRQFYEKTESHRIDRRKELFEYLEYLENPPM